MNLRQVEINGLDLQASIADGAAHSGRSRWPAGESAFLIRNRGIVLQWLQLNAPFEQTSVQGTLGFGSDGREYSGAPGRKLNFSVDFSLP